MGFFRTLLKKYVNYVTRHFLHSVLDEWLIHIHIHGGCIKRSVVEWDRERWRDGWRERDREMKRETGEQRETGEERYVERGRDRWRERQRWREERKPDPSQDYLHKCFHCHNIDHVQHLLNIAGWVMRRTYRCCLLLLLLVLPTAPGWQPTKRAKKPTLFKSSPPPPMKHD